MKFYLASTASTASDTTNPYCLINKYLEFYPPSNNCQGLGIQPSQSLETQTYLNQRQGSRSHLAATLSNFFTNVFNISNVTSSSTKALATSYSLSHGCCWSINIKESTSIVYSLCKHTWEDMVYIVLTNKGHPGPEIWPQTL